MKHWHKLTIICLLLSCGETRTPIEFPPDDCLFVETMRSSGEPCLHCPSSPGRLEVSAIRVTLAADAPSSITLFNVGRENLKVLSLSLLDSAGEPTSVVEPADMATERWLSPPTQCQTIYIASLSEMKLNLRYRPDREPALAPKPYRLLIESTDTVWPMLEIELEAPNMEEFP